MDFIEVIQLFCLAYCKTMCLVGILFYSCTICISCGFFSGKDISCIFFFSNDFVHVFLISHIHHNSPTPQDIEYVS